MVSQFFPTVVKFSPLSAAISETSISKILSKQHVALLAYQLSGLDVGASATNPRKAPGPQRRCGAHYSAFFFYLFSIKFSLNCAR